MTKRGDNGGATMPCVAGGRHSGDRHPPQEPVYDVVRRAPRAAGLVSAREWMRLCPAAASSPGYGGDSGLVSQHTMCN